MPCKDELPVVSGSHENREGVAEHSSSINGDIWLPGHFCIVRLMKAVTHLDVQG